MFEFPERAQYTAVLHVLLTSLVEQINFSIYMNKSQKLWTWMWCSKVGVHASFEQLLSNK